LRVRYFIAISRYGLHAFGLMEKMPEIALGAAAYVFEQGMRDLPRDRCT
jgi:hypothetical protein